MLAHRHQPFPFLKDRKIMNLHRLAETLSNLPSNIAFHINAGGIVVSETSHPTPVVTTSNKYDIEINGGSEKYSQWTALVGLTRQPGYTGALMDSREKITEVTAQRLYRLSQDSTKKPVTFMFTAVRDDSSNPPTNKSCILRLKTTETS